MLSVCSIILSLATAGVKCGEEQFLDPRSLGKSIAVILRCRSFLADGLMNLVAANGGRIGKIKLLESVMFGEDTCHT